MTGIEVIVNQILDEAKDKEKQILGEADTAIVEISSKAKAEVEKFENDLYKKYELDLKNYQSAAILMAEQKKKRAILNAKQEYIEKIMDKTYEKLIGSEDGEYFDYVLKLVKKYALPQDGYIIFNEKDRNRMPADLMEKIQGIAKEKGGSLTMSDEQRKIDGGFVLVYGGIEENCIFKSLMEIEKEKLHDLVNEMVFC